MSTGTLFPYARHKPASLLSAQSWNRGLQSHYTGPIENVLQEAHGCLLPGAHVFFFVCVVCHLLAG